MKMIACLILLSTVFLVTSNPETVDKILKQFEKAPTKELFKVYHFLFKKDYDLNSEEGLRRYKIFKDNLAFIKKSNSENHTYTLGLTPFADMTNQEYREKMTSHFTSVTERFLREVNFDMEADKDTPQEIPEVTQAAIDWRNFLLPARDQGAVCGSCWAFATAAIIEGNYAIKNRRVGEYLSVQQLVDCDANDNGCSGGHAARAILYAQQMGLCKDSNYPYTEANGGCKINTKCPVAPVGYDYCMGTYKPCTGGVWTGLLSRGPIAVGVDSDSQQFQLYIGGLLTGTTMRCVRPNHAVTAVGLANGVVTVRNSWGLNWGVAGHFQISQNDSCFVTTEAVIPIFP